MDHKDDAGHEGHEMVHDHKHHEMHGHLAHQVLQS